MRGQAQAAIAVVALAVVVCACGGAGTVTATPASARCPLSTPGGPPPPHRALLNFGTAMARPSDPGLYGNGVLWTLLPTFAKQTPLARGGTLHLKIPWFRGGTGRVRIDGSPVGGPPARFAADVGTPAQYGRYGFAPSILQFGRAGCWRLHARLASRVLTLVVRVSSPHTPAARRSARSPATRRSSDRAATASDRTRLPRTT